MGLDPVTGGIIAAVAGGGISALGSGGKSQKAEIPGTEWVQTLPPEIRDQLSQALGNLQGMDINGLLQKYAQPTDPSQINAPIDPRMNDIINQILGYPATNINNQFTNDAAAGYRTQQGTQAANIYDPNSPEGKAWQANVEATRARTQEDIDANLARTRERFGLQGGLYGSPVDDTMGNVVQKAITGMEQSLSQQALGQQNFASQQAQNAQQFGTQGLSGLGANQTQAELYRNMNYLNQLLSGAGLLGKQQQTTQEGLNRTYEDAQGGKQVGLGLETQMPFNIYNAILNYANANRLQPSTADQTVYNPNNPWSDAFSQMSYLFGNNNWLDNSGSNSSNNPYTGTYSADLPMSPWEL